MEDKGSRGRNEGGEDRLPGEEWVGWNRDTDEGDSA